MRECDDLRLTICAQVDVERARRAARALARTLGFSREDIEAIGLAVSELTSNLVRYAHAGEIAVRPLLRDHAVGIEVRSRDRGPGIANLDAAMQDGVSTSGSLGVGLPGVRRLMDDFELASGPTGTRVVCRKWRPSS